MQQTHCVSGLGVHVNRYGYIQYEVDIMYLTVFILIVVSSVQMPGNYSVTKLNRD